MTAIAQPARPPEGSAERANLHLEQVDPALLHDVLKNDPDIAAMVQNGVMADPLSLRLHQSPIRVVVRRLVGERPPASVVGTPPRPLRRTPPFLPILHEEHLAVTGTTG